MLTVIHYACMPLAIGAFCAVLVALVYRWRWYRCVVYRYSLADYVAQRLGRFATYRNVILVLLRVATLLLLAWLIGKPQIPDRRTTVNVNGIDIMLIIDVSGSMACFDDEHDNRSRLAIAQQEAIRFIDQREHDALGLVVFGNGALSACPLTHDRAVLREIIEQIQVGSMVDDRCTLLSYGMLTGLNRLKQSTSPSKVMIVLTDGQPSAHDVPVHVPLEIAKKLGVKIYTIGIGSEHGGFCKGPGGMLIASGVQLNETLLAYLAQQTGGVFYRARNASQMRSIYDTIDRLEKRPMPVSLYTRYYDIFEPFLWALVALLSTEVVLSSLIWKSL